MTSFDFDQYIDRKHTSSEKWDLYKNQDIIPLWVADMDFASPPQVIKALHKRIDHAIFGYTNPPSELIEVFIHRIKKNYNWEIQPEWIVWLPGLVCAINLSCRAVANKNEEIFTGVPIYPPFLYSPLLSKQKVVSIPFKYDDFQWKLNTKELEQKITSQSKLFLLCNPHNPLGMVYSKNELEKLSSICLKNNIIICSDEIHCELILDKNKKHIPIATLSPEIEQQTITLMAASKTFNIAGLGCSMAIIPNESLRRKFKQVRKGIVPPVNLLGYTATLAAYRDSHEWHKALLDYLRKNARFLEKRIENIRGLYMTPVEATYLAWIDVTDLNLKNPRYFFEKYAKVGLSDGTFFGTPQYLRFNFGCPKPLLEKALNQIEEAIKTK